MQLVYAQLLDHPPDSPYVASVRIRFILNWCHPTQAKSWLRWWAAWQGYSSMQRMTHHGLGGYCLFRYPHLPRF